MRTRWALGLALVTAAGCAPTGGGNRADRTGSLQGALDRYRRLVVGMQSDSIAALFTADGELAAAGQPAIVGPEAIRVASR